MFLFSYFDYCLCRLVLYLFIISTVIKHTKSEFLDKPPCAIHFRFPLSCFRGSLMLVSTCLICPSIHLKRSRRRRFCPSSPGRSPLSTPRRSRRSVSLSRSLRAPLRVNSPFRCWSCGSSTWTRPQEEAFMSTASPRKGHGNLLGVAVDATPPRYHNQTGFTNLI